MEAQEKWIDEFENMKDTAESNYSYTVRSKGCSDSR